MTITKVKNGNDLTSFKLSEVAQMNGKDSKPCWIIVNDLVYDVASFLDEHPGGIELIMGFAGKDCTKDFNDVGHSADAIKDLNRCLVGQLVEVREEKNIKFDKQIQISFICSTRRIRSETERNPV